MDIIKHFNNYRKRQFTSLLILGILILSLAIATYLIQQRQNTRSKASKEPNANNKIITKGYIVELKDDPSVEHQAKSEQIMGITSSSINENVLSSEAARIRTKQINDYEKSVILPKQQAAKKDILKRLGKEKILGTNSNSPEENPISREYSKVVNGFALNVSQKEIEEVKQSPYVKSVYPNLQAKINLAESVGIINANQAWNLKDKNGKNLTGEGVIVGVLDTGVDLTHPDLGSSTLTDRNFEVVNPNSIKSVVGFDNLRDKIFSMNNNRIVYFSENKIYLYSFVSKTTTTIDTFSQDIYPVRLILKNDDLLYYGSDKNTSTASLYYYNIASQVSKKVADSSAIGNAYKYNNKIFYVGYDGENSQMYSYDLNNNSTSVIPFEYADYLFAASGNKIIYTVPGEYCYAKAVIYNLDDGTSRSINPSNLGGILDFKGNQIVYTPCDPDTVYQDFSSFYLYNIDNGQYEFINVSPFISNETIKKNGGFGIISFISKARIGSGVIYASNPYSSPKIKAYDLNTKRYAKINIYKNAYEFQSEGQRVCFISDDKKIYCHQYVSSDPYNVPSDNIYNSKVVDGYNFVENNNIPIDDNGHGTHVAGIIGSNGTLKGVAPNSKIVAYKVFDAQGITYFSDVLAAIEAGVQTKLDSNPNNDISVLNLSMGADCNYYYGGYTADCGPADLLSTALDNASEAGIVPVISAGNSGPGAETVQSPGTSRKSITVAATDKANLTAYFSSRGPVVWNGEDIKKPDVAAPGVSICSSEMGNYLEESRCVDDKHISMSGTSMAAPHVAGIVALMKQANPSAPTSLIKSSIKNKAKYLGFSADEQGAGLVDALESVKSIAEQAPTSTPTIPTPTSAPTYTPTPLPTSTPSPTVAPSPTPIGLFTGINLHLKIIGLGNGINENTNPNHKVRSAAVEIYNLQNEKVAGGSGDLVFGNNIFSGMVNLGNVVDGYYYIKVKAGDGTLVKTIGSIAQNIKKDTINELPQANIFAGDMKGDNVLDLLDYTEFVGCYGSKQCANKSMADLNDDGNVNGLDYIIMLRAFSERTGD